jgi:putative aldouronate transport system permease protein
MYNSGSDLLMDVIVGIICLIVVSFCLFPFVYTLSLSISNPLRVIRGEVKLFPKGFSVSAYRFLFQHPNLVNSYKNTIIYTVLGTAYSLIVTGMAAFVMAKRSFPGKKFLGYYLLIPMLFGGGLIPTFLVVVGLGLYNTYASQIIVGGVSIWNLIIMRTFMQSIPISLKESARMDGAGDWAIFTKIYIPMCTAVIAIIGLFYAVGRWNDFFSALIYLEDERKYPVQLVIYQLLITAEDKLNAAISMGATKIGAAGSAQNFTSLSFKAAVVVVTMFPVMAVYPFIQKYFTKGMMIGAIKG